MMWLILNPITYSLSFIFFVVFHFIVSFFYLIVEASSQLEVSWDELDPEDIPPLVLMVVGNKMLKFLLTFITIDSIIFLVTAYSTYI